MICKHDLEKMWCSLCNGNKTIIVRDPTISMCCAPNCDKASSKQVASLPLCIPHYNRLENHIADNIAPDHAKLNRFLEKVTRREWVYFVRLGEPIKVGFSTQVASRVRSYAAYGQGVEVLGLELGGRDLEARLHRRFAPHKAVVGFSRELFDPAPELLDYIQSGRGCAMCDARALENRVFCERHANVSGFETEEALIGRVIARRPQLTA